MKVCVKEMVGRMDFQNLCDDRCSFKYVCLKLTQICCHVWYHRVMHIKCVLQTQML